MTICGGACEQELDFDFTMAFQPVVDIKSQSIYAQEALVRGLNGEGAGVILGRVTDQNRYSFDQACRVKAIQLAAEHQIEGRLNINFLPNAVYHPQACLQKTLAAAKQYNFDQHRITFEFTENEQIMDRAKLSDIVRTYRAANFETALDDFGTGFSGLSLLADFQPTTLKIDRELVMGIDQDSIRQAIVEGIVLVCEKVGISIVAEGVETEPEAKTLLNLGIHRFQGFLFAKPSLVPLKTKDISFFGLKVAI